MKNYYYITKRGLERISPVSLGVRQRLGETLSQLYDYLSLSSEVNPDLTFEDLFDHDETFRSLCIESLSLAGINYEDTFITEIYELLLPHKDHITGEPRANGLISLVNFKGLASRSKNDSGGDATFADILATLWSIQANLKDAIETMFDPRVSADELLEAIEKFQELKNPEETRKRKLQKKAMDTLSTSPEAGPRIEWEEVDPF